MNSTNDTIWAGANLTSPVYEELPASVSRGPAVLRGSLYAICVVGIILNVAVFWKRKFRSKRQSQTTRISLQLLCFMAAADTISLAALLLLLCTRYLGIKDDLSMSIICKVDMFLIHAASAFSIWCWLVLSAVRYIAIFRPYMHLKINREPVVAVVVIAVMCCFLQSWILYGTGFIGVGCMTLESNISEDLAQKLHLFEIAWSYFLPFILITVLDIRVLCFHSRWFESLDFPVSASITSATIQMKANTKRCVKQISFSGSEYEGMLENKGSPTAYGAKPLLSDIYENPVHELPTIIEAKKFVEKEAVYKNPLWRLFHVMQAVQPTIGKIKPKRSRRRIQQIRILRRCLCITLLDLSMNLPNYLFRLYVNLLSAEEYQSLQNSFGFLYTFIEDISQLLYFAQFSLNALYLVYLVYDSPRKRSSGSNAYSISIYRQPSRLDS